MKKRTLLQLSFTALLTVSTTFIAPLEAHAFTGLNGRIGFQDQDTAQIRSILPDGSQEKSVTDFSVEDFRFHPTGTSIVYTTPPGELAIKSRNIDGTNDQMLYNTGAIEFMPTWSPTGNEIAFSRNDSTYIISIMNSDGTGLTDITSTYAIEADWSPDGTKIVFTGTDGDTEIYVMDRDGSNITKLTDNAVPDWQPRWSPDGSKIIYRSSSTVHFQIHTMDADGSNDAAITNTELHNYAPVWSPDGTKIAFTRLEDSQYNLYVADADGSNATKVRDDVDYNVVDWQPLVNTPSSETPNKTVTTNESGIASLDIASMFTDPYDGIDAGTLEITSGPTSGTVTVDNGVATYTRSQTAQNSNVLSMLLAYITPTVSAQGTDDSFSYQICSQTNSQLCGTGTIGVTFGAASPALADTGSSLIYTLSIAAVLVLTSHVLARTKQLYTS